MSPRGTRARVCRSTQQNPDAPGARVGGRQAAPREGAQRGALGWPPVPRTAHHRPRASPAGSPGAPGSDWGPGLLEPSCAGPGTPTPVSPSGLARPRLLRPLSLRSGWDQGWVPWAGGERGPGARRGPEGSRLMPRAPGVSLRERAPRAGAGGAAGRTAEPCRQGAAWGAPEPLQEPEGTPYGSLGQFQGDLGSEHARTCPAHSPAPGHFSCPVVTRGRQGPEAEQWENPPVFQVLGLTLTSSRFLAPRPLVGRGAH